MNKIIYYMVFSISSFLFTGCSGPSPTREEMIGTWVGSGGAEVDINKDGTFTGMHFPFKKFFPRSFIKPKDSARTEYDGGGKWAIKYEDPYWKIKLDFDTSSVPGYLCHNELLIGGENGILDNKRPWYLYYWVDEEGGERFKFSKK